VHPDDGGRLGQIEVAGRPLLRGAEHAHLGWSEWGCYPLLPWSNRIPAGRFEFAGRVHEVPVNWRDGSAIHGLAASVLWTVDASTETTLTESIEVAEGPYRVRGRQNFTITPTALTLDLAVTNEAELEVPAGLGIHPWFVGGPVRVPADLVWPGTTPLPDGPARAVTPDEDLRVARVPPVMDRCYTGLSGTSAEVPGLRLEWWGPITQVVVYSGEPGWVCVEPVTMANDGFRLAAEGVDGHGVVVLAPHASMAVRYVFGWA
jgi:aldose 1-epimerase